MALTQTATEAELMAEYWNDVFLSELRDHLQFAQFGMKSTHPTGAGTLAHWLSLADMTAAAALSEGYDPTSYGLSAGDQTATVSQYGASVRISDLLKKTMVPGSYEQIVERLARNAQKTIDQTIYAGVFSGGGTVQYAGTAVARNSIATSGFDMNMAEIRQATNTLAKAGAQTYMDGYYVGVISPDVQYDLQGDTAQWQEVLKNTETGFGILNDNYTGARPGFNGVIGALFGVKFIQSQIDGLILDASGSASTDVYQSYIFGPEHFGVSELDGVQVIMKDPHPSSDLELYGTAGWKAAFAYKELNASRMVRIESGASLGD